MDSEFRAWGCAVLSVFLALVAGLIWFNTTPGTDRGDCVWKSTSTGNTSTDDCSFTDRGALGDVSFATLAVSLVYLIGFYTWMGLRVIGRKDLLLQTRLKRLAIYLVILTIVLYVALQARANYLDGLRSVPQPPA